MRIPGFGSRQAKLLMGLPEDIPPGILIGMHGHVPESFQGYRYFGGGAQGHKRRHR